VTLSLAWFVATNAVMSALILSTAPLILRREPSRAPGFWLAFRLAPAAFSIAFVVLVFAPSYWRYEPREGVEGFDLTLTMLAISALGLFGAAIVRGFSAWRTAARRVKSWLQGAGSIVVGTTRCFVLETDRPMLALSGIVHPRLVVTRGLVEALNDSELAAAVAHELGHRRAWDNLKRLVIRSAPDFLGSSRIARQLERRWASAAEHAADRAVGRRVSARCALASALVKIARRTTAAPAAALEPTQLGEPISTLGEGEIASRVRLLLEDGDVAQTRWLRMVTGITAVAATTILVVSYVPILRLIHDATEIAIRILP
jgi:Zn-dependent protease with chaperone function